MFARYLWSDQPLAPPVEDVKLSWKSRQISLCDPSWVSRIEKKVVVQFKLFKALLSHSYSNSYTYQKNLGLRRVSQSQPLSCSRVMRELCTNFKKCVSQSKFENNPGSYSRVMHELKFENKCISQSMHELLFSSYARVMHESWRITYSRGRASITREQAAK